MSNRKPSKQAIEARPTEGARALAAFLRERQINGADTARALGVTQAAVIKWVRATARPRHETRQMIETWTGGKVKAALWFTADERRAMRSVEQAA